MKIAACVLAFLMGALAGLLLALIQPDHMDQD